MFGMIRDIGPIYPAMGHRLHRFKNYVSKSDFIKTMGTL